MLFNSRTIHIISEAILFIILYIFLSGRINKTNASLTDAHAKIAELETRIALLEHMISPSQKPAVQVPEEIVQDPIQVSEPIRVVDVPTSVAVEEEFSKYKISPQVRTPFIEEEHMSNEKEQSTDEEKSTSDESE